MKYEFKKMSLLVKSDREGEIRYEKKLKYEEETSEQTAESGVMTDYDEGQYENNNPRPASNAKPLS